MSCKAYTQIYISVAEDDDELSISEQQFVCFFLSLLPKHSLSGVKWYNLDAWSALGIATWSLAAQNDLASSQNKVLEALQEIELSFGRSLNSNWWWMMILQASVCTHCQIQIIWFGKGLSNCESISCRASQFVTQRSDTWARKGHCFNRVNGPIGLFLSLIVYGYGCSKLDLRFRFRLSRGR